MKTPSSRQAQLELAERLVAGILQQVFRLNSNARLRSRDELHAHLLPLNGVTGAERRNASRPAQCSHSQRQRRKPAHVNSNAQNALIVSGKSQKQKPRVKVYGPRLAKTSKWTRLADPEERRRFERHCLRRREGLTGAVATRSNEACVRVIARGLAQCSFLVGLRVGHARVDALDNLFLGEP